MFESIFSVLYGLINGLVDGTINVLINPVFENFSDGSGLQAIQVNLSLFSETPIISTNLYDLITMFFTIFYSMFFIVLLYKVSKKIIKSIFGVLKWW